MRAVTFSLCLSRPCILQLATYLGGNLSLLIRVRLKLESRALNNTMSPRKDGWHTDFFLESWPHLEATVSASREPQLTKSYASNGLRVRSGYEQSNEQWSFTPLGSSIHTTSTFQSGEPQISSKLSGSRGFASGWLPKCRWTSIESRWKPEI
jgi:hypothetical protein